LLEAYEKVAKPYSIVLAPKTALFAIEFLDPRKNNWVPEWIYTNQLPKMARVAIDFGANPPPATLNSDVSLQVIPMNAVAITRAGAMSGPLPNAPGSIPGGPLDPGMEDVWQPNLPSGFGQNRGNVQENPIFPRGPSF
jgi:hypothetical protein